MDREFRIVGARENNLKGFSLRIPHYKLIVVSGVSGSGKSSLVNELINREGQRLFYENFTDGNFHSGKKIAPPDADLIQGLFPVISVNQFSVVRNPRSTVGTLTEIHDFLRLLFARLGTIDGQKAGLSRSHFSWNHPDGQCPVCKGLGVEDHIDPDTIVGYPERSLRQGALVLTTPNNYIIYSQVTMEVLNQVCNAEGFNVDIPWKDLTEEQKKVIWYGSEKIKILFGKHPLESRLKWSGITAKPREEGYYKGILPVMEEILKRDRNPNILRFTRSFTCPACNGERLKPETLAVRYAGKNPAEFLHLSIEELDEFLHSYPISEKEKNVAGPVIESILKRTEILKKLGLGFLTLDRESTSLSGGESGRIRLGNQVSTCLQNILYILDEPSAGLHPSEQESLLDVIRSLVQQGNTVIAVEHDEITMRAADWIIDIGPGPGEKGGEVMYQGPAETFFQHPPSNSITAQCLLETRERPAPTHPQHGTFTIREAKLNNLKGFDAHYHFRALNVITGVSGSGKSSLAKFIREVSMATGKDGCENFKKVIHVDQSPIGRTPNSNPATYTGLSDHVRDLFAALPASKEKNYKKGQFSFVVKGGRCEACKGAGTQQVGMHFLGNVSVICEECNGQRFTEETLSVKYKDKNIFDVLNLTLEEAHQFFEGQKKITSITSILIQLGLSYLKLGQASNTLSGGEAQRVKLATELATPASGQCLYILDEPTTGLHMQDVKVLLSALRQLITKGHTLLCIEHDPYFILQADHLTDLGPGSGQDGGKLVFEGSPGELINTQNNKTAEALRAYFENFFVTSASSGLSVNKSENLVLKGVTTNNLKNIDISFPADTISVVSGVSGSGKSSLVVDTLYSESQRRFMEGMSSYIRQFIGKVGNPELEDSSGLRPAIFVGKKKAGKNPRSTVGTYLGLYDLYRLLFSRLAKDQDGEKPGLSTLFSFNHEEGACPECSGIGKRISCDPEKLINHPEKSLLEGAMDGSKSGKFYGDPFGQYTACLRAVGSKYNLDFNKPWSDLEENARQIAMFGCGDEIFNVDWQYKRGQHEGIHQMKTVWPGFVGHVNEEYQRKHADHRGEAMMPLMTEYDCSSCRGTRLNAKALTYLIKEVNIASLAAMDATEAIVWFQNISAENAWKEIEKKVLEAITNEVSKKLRGMVAAGLGYISIDRLLSGLSGGEYQRLRLAGILHSSLSGISIILDEPSFGLHQQDAEKIAGLISDVQQRGNTVIMVDSTPLMTNIADYSVEIGPAAGSAGGELIYAGRPQKILEKLKSYKSAPLFTAPTQKGKISIRGANANNLQNIDLDIPLEGLALIKGVSGSGKSSLLQEVIAASGKIGKAVKCKEISGFEDFSEIIFVEQELPSASPISTVITFSGLLDTVRKTFAACQESKANGFSASHFSFHTKEGQCPECQGKGFSSVSMDFWSDARIVCESCLGARYREDVLSVSIDGKNIAELLAGSIVELHKWCEKKLTPTDLKKAEKRFHAIEQCGLAYLSPGQSLDTLSTGELQRLKLAVSVSDADSKTLFLLDEPTGGLHPEDTLQLLDFFNILLERGNSILCVSHDKLLQESASWSVSLGPGGGKYGGEII